MPQLGPAQRSNFLQQVGLLRTKALRGDRLSRVKLLRLFAAFAEEPLCVQERRRFVRDIARRQAAERLTVAGLRTNPQPRERLVGGPRIEAKPMESEAVRRPQGAKGGGKNPGPQPEQAVAFAGAK